MSKRRKDLYRKVRAADRWIAKQSKPGHEYADFRLWILQNLPHSAQPSVKSRSRYGWSSKK